MKKKHAENMCLCTHETNNYLAMKAAATTILAISKTQDKIKASNVSNLKFNERLFFIIFCLEDPHSHTTHVLVGITPYLLPPHSIKMVNWYANGSYAHKNFMIQIGLCSHIHVRNL